VDGTELKQLAVIKMGEENWTYGLAFSPDGKALAAGCGAGHLSFWRLDGATPREVAAGDTGADFNRNLVFSHDGRSLACIGTYFSAMNKISVCFFDLSGARPKLRRKVEVERETPWGWDSLTQIALTPDDRRLLLLVRDELMVLDADSGKMLYRRRMPGRVVDADFAPDGRHLAVANGNGTVYILRLPALDEKPRDK
jgi:WD40 repeat protein